jgi:MOSC domain-containing protein YiiM
MTAQLAGIARHTEAKGPIETLAAAAVTSAEGVRGDHRGRLASARPERTRQVSLIERECWTAAAAEAGTQLEWWNSRRNLLLDGLRLPRAPGTLVQIGATLVIEITEECNPCERMEALHAGLQQALAPDWRAGFLGRVIADGEIALGDPVRIL